MCVNMVVRGAVQHLTAGRHTTVNKAAQLPVHQLIPVSLHGRTPFSRQQLCNPPYCQHYQNNRLQMAHMRVSRRSVRAMAGMYDKQQP